MYQSDPTQRIKLQELFLSSHFLFVPTLAECFGIVFAEAQAFALPPVSNAVHAVPSVVKHKETGMLFYELSPARHYTEKILECFDDREAYETMCIKARQRYQTSLNWDNTANIIALAIEQKLAA
jgi:glycosyltransferase involved in cell wall biosynthesis